jgi:hypothetical protein
VEAASFAIGGDLPIVRREMKCDRAVPAMTEMSGMRCSGLRHTCPVGVLGSVLANRCLSVCAPRGGIGL